MNVTINDAMNAFALLEHVCENSYLKECYNLGISALKTIQDGNFQLAINTVSRETLEEMANFNCEGLDCDKCIYRKATEDGGFICMSIKAKDVIWYLQNIKEVSEWINQNVKN